MPHDGAVAFGPTTRQRGQQHFLDFDERLAVLVVAPTDARQ